MKFKNLFYVMGEGVEMEVFREPAGHLCTVTRGSRVPREVWFSDVKTVTPSGIDQAIVFLEGDDSHERED